MNKYTKRILLANDIIQQIDRGVLQADDGFLLSEETYDKLRNNSYKTLQQKVCSLKKCEACANGALLLAYIGRFNTVETVMDIDYENVQTATPLKELFTHKQLDEIEYLFEGVWFPWNQKFTEEEKAKLNVFRLNIIGNGNDGWILRQKNVLLKAIMTTLINNDGKKVVL